MNESSFIFLYELVTSRGEGWLLALREAWFGGCLTEDQKNLLKAVS